MARAHEQPVHVAGPTDRDGASGYRVFEHERPAHDPGEAFTQHAVGIGVGRSGNRNHRCQFRVGECRQRAYNGCYDEGDNHARTGFLAGLGGKHENTRADDRADTQQGELDRAELSCETFLFGCCEDLVERFHALKKH